MAPFYIDFHCTLEEHQSWSQNREILLGKPSAHRSTPDVVVLFGRGAGDADAAFGFMGNIHIQGSGALLIPYGVSPHPPQLYRQGKHQSTHFRELPSNITPYRAHYNYVLHILYDTKRSTTRNSDHLVIYLGLISQLNVNNCCNKKHPKTYIQWLQHHFVSNGSNMLHSHINI